MSQRCCVPQAVMILLILVSGMIGSARAGEADIRPQPGGKRLLFVDNDDIRPEPGGKRLLFIDGDDIRPEPGGKRLLFVDGDDVRREPGGIRLAFLDGKELRRSPGGKVLLYIDHPDICPTASSNRIYFIDGDKLTKPQLIAVLYQLKPELFKLSRQEEARLKKEMAAARAESDNESAKDAALGTYDLIQFYSSDDQKRAGKMVVVRKDIPECKEALYSLSLQFKDEPEWEGVAVRKKDELWAAIGPKNTVGLAMYEIDEGNLDGVWFPFYAPGTVKANLGTEKLTGAAALGGEYTITDAKAPKTGAPYAGTVTLTPHKIPFDGDVPYLLNWNFGKVQIPGVGLQVGNSLFVCSSSGKDFAVVKFRLEKGNLVGDFFSHGKAKGYYTFIK